VVIVTTTTDVLVIRVVLSAQIYTKGSPPDDHGLRVIGWSLFGTPGSSSRELVVFFEEKKVVNDVLPLSSNGKWVLVYAGSVIVQGNAIGFPTARAAAKAITLSYRDKYQQVSCRELEGDRP
jgi:hypothetical protein